MTAQFYPPARYRPVRNTAGAMSRPTRGMIPHVQVGLGSLYGWFNNPASKVSSHLWLSKTGDWEQYVPLDRRAWAQAAGNPYWISIECEGYETEPHTDTQVEKLGEFFAWGMREFGWRPEITDSPDGCGIGTHRMGGRAWGAHSCPGDLRADQRRDILAHARSCYLATTASATPQAGADRYAGRPTLRRGSVGADVVEAQNALNIVQGYEGTHPLRLIPDGIFGPMTEGRTRTFQHAVALTVDGVIGPRTWTALALQLARMGRTV